LGSKARETRIRLRRPLDRPKDRHCLALVYFDSIFFHLLDTSVYSHFCWAFQSRLLTSPHQAEGLNTVAFSVPALHLLHYFQMAANLDTAAGDHFQPSLNNLPDEVLQHILYYLPPYDVLASVQRVSKRFQGLASEPLLWRYHCRVLFRYWDSKHRIRRKFMGKAADVDWKILYTHRMKVDFDTTSTLDSILSGQVNRIQKFRIIAEFGYDAKDTLLRHCHTNDEAEDVLARRQASILP
jgi:hypothetical protein